MTLRAPFSFSSLIFGSDAVASLGALRDETNMTAWDPERGMSMYSKFYCSLIPPQITADYYTRQFHLSFNARLTIKTFQISRQNLNIFVADQKESGLESTENDPHPSLESSLSTKTIWRKT